MRPTIGGSETKCYGKMDLNFGKWLNNFESSGTLLSKVVELRQLWQLYNFAKLRKLPKVEVDVFLMISLLLSVKKKVTTKPRFIDYFAQCRLSLSPKAIPPQR